jgi:hypothetical protein
MCIELRHHSLRAGSVGVALLAAYFVGILGCGKPSYQLETAPVTGTVTLDGQPLPSGYVTLVTSHGRMSSGTIQADGTFALSTYKHGDGGRVGTHPVIVTPVPPDQATSGKRVPVPDRYTKAGTSGWTFEVKPGEDNVLKLEMTTKEQKKK